MQAEATIYFVVWWVLFEYGSFDPFPYIVPVKRTYYVCPRARVWASVHTGPAEIILNSGKFSSQQNQEICNFWRLSDMGTN